MRRKAAEEAHFLGVIQQHPDGIHGEDIYKEASAIERPPKKSLSRRAVRAMVRLAGREPRRPYPKPHYSLANSLKRLEKKGVITTELDTENTTRLGDPRVLYKAAAPSSQSSSKTRTFWSRR